MKDLCVFLCSISLVLAAREIDYRCAPGDEYFYATAESQCNGYYQCQQGGSIIKHNCDQGAYFNYFQQSCVRFEGVCYESVCSGKANGRYSDTTHACRRYFECENGQFKSISTCPLGQLFNGISCAAEASVHCGLPVNNAIAYPKVATLAVPRDVCHGLSDGYHSDPQSLNCQEYLSCSQGLLVERLSCGDQGAFDELMRKCIPSQVYNCATHHRFQTASSITSFTRTQLVQADAKRFDICMHKTNGFHINVRLGCRYYVKCTSRTTIAQFECPVNQVFDVRTKSCQSESNLLCINPVPSKDCDSQNDGFYTMPRSDCKTYFSCFNGKKTILRCPDGLVFDGRDCVTQGSGFECPIVDETCASKPDGYYRDFGSDSCRSYHYCANGKKVTYLCAENQVWSSDVEKCVLRGPNHSTSECGQSECTERPDGYYQNVASGCREYHYCLRGQKVNVLTCRDQKIFDGQSCVSPSSYNCRAGTRKCVKKSCRPECERDGFYSDYNSGCRSYYFCIAGMKSVLQCSEGYVFDGESCVSKLNYTCPQYCNDSAEECR